MWIEGLYSMWTARLILMLISLFLIQLPGVSLLTRHSRQTQDNNNISNRLSYVEALLKAERSRADAERLRANAERLRADSMQKELSEIKSQMNTLLSSIANRRPACDDELIKSYVGEIITNTLDSIQDGLITEKNNRLQHDNMLLQIKDIVGRTQQTVNNNYNVLENKTNQMEDRIKYLEQTCVIIPKTGPITAQTKPTTSSTRPTTRQTRPTTGSTRPTTRQTSLTTSSTRPTTPQAKPTTSSTRPTTRQTSLTTSSTRPTTRRTSPTTSSTRPTTRQTSPTTSSSRPTTRQTSPTTRPTTRQTSPATSSTIRPTQTIATEEHVTPSPIPRITHNVQFSGQPLNHNDRRIAKDCRHLLELGYPDAGVYRVDITQDNPVLLYCYPLVGFMYVQRRQNNVTGFNKSWEEYKYGFGNFDSDYWIGNEILGQAIHFSTRRETFLGIFYDNRFYQTLSFLNVQLSNERDGYQLQYSEIWKSDTFPRDQIPVNGSTFMTSDRQSRGGNCSDVTGGWWYQRGSGCATTPYNPNSRFYKKSFIAIVFNN